MTVLPLVIAPDPRLKQKSLPVEKVDDSLRAFMDDMVESMYASGGIGLAAVQVGVLKRILVMDIYARFREHDHHHHDGPCNYHHEVENPDPLFLVNPEIIEESKEENVYEEGCLSFPGQSAEVTRPKKVKVKYLDYNGEERILEADGLLATCVQHEMDHLNGITFVDYLSRMKRDMILRKLKKEKKQG